MDADGCVCEIISMKTMVFKWIFHLFTPIIVGSGDTQEKKIIRIWWTEPHLERAVWKQRNTVERRGKPKNKRNDKAPLLSIFDVSKLVVASLSLASRKMKEGKEDLAQFIANRRSKVADKAIQVGWELEEAEENWKGHKWQWWKYNKKL